LSFNKPIVIRDKLRLSVQPKACGICGEVRAHWLLQTGEEASSGPVCSLCYLYEETVHGYTDAFADFLKAVRMQSGRPIELVDGKLTSATEADLALCALVTTSRMFEAEDERGGLPSR